MNEQAPIQLVRVDEKNEQLSPQQAANELAEGGNINKIRDILFGGQMRDYDRRFVRLEERIGKEMNDLRDESRKRIDSLETFFRKEIDALSVRVIGEQNIRTDAVRELVQGLKDLSVNFDRKLSQMGEQNNRNDSELRQQLLEQSKVIREEIQGRYSELLKAIDREAVELRHEKTDRTALSEMFAELAMRLNNDLRLPNG
ncbi:MAG: hypothetical protein H7Z37_07890 [Pyrinomonadaceae bacterium]|nr:hypothetical protein [Pyrinomonadaceae bacterium]